jgi:hypothetical protein
MDLCWSNQTNYFLVVGTIVMGLCIHLCMKFEPVR